MNDHPQVLLIDGMSLLVRSAKAGAKMMPLSHQGVSTNTLVTFTGTLVRHLRLAPWDYVLVSWEGEPELNWRRKLYPEYKSGRPVHRDDAPLMSIDQELAMGFCDAAGLYQSWQSDMEGDDILAEAWRLFRGLGSQPYMTIVTEDRDLLQLTEPGTVWRAWSTDVTTAGDVLETYMVPPARLALLRALAGDASDEIPGIKGIGPVTAANMIDEKLTDMENISSYVVKLGIEPMFQVMTWWLISDLRSPVMRPRLGTAGELSESTAWHPEEHLGELLGFLKSYGMNRLMIRVESGDTPWAN
jgi:DNA polymerase-1